MKVCFIAFGPILFASSRLRCHWPARHMEDATVVTFGDPLPDADVYIWQKNAHLGQIAERQDAAHWWDVCDPLHWFSPNESRRIADRVDGIVASNEELADDLAKWAGREVTTIRDRIEPDHYPLQRQHSDNNPLRFIWYGLGVNRAALVGAWTCLCRLAALGYEIELTVFDDRPEVEFAPGPEVPIYHKKWRLHDENRILAAHDIALVPPYPGMWGKVKSDNKRLTAWACGLPDVTGYDWAGVEYGEGLLSIVENADMRQILGDSGRKLVEGPHHVKHSAAEWEALLCAS